MERAHLIRWIESVRRAAHRLSFEPGNITLSASGLHDLCKQVLVHLGEDMSQQKIRLAHIYIEQAEVARQQSDLPGAIASFTKAIELYKAMAQEEPACWSLVADTIERAAATYKAAGDLDNAKEAFKEAATLREKLIQLEAKPAEE